MNVIELIKELQELPEDMEIYLQKDSEGNGYLPLRGADPYCIWANREIYDINLCAEEHCLDEEEWEEIKRDNKRSLVLFP